MHQEKHIQPVFLPTRCHCDSDASLSVFQSKIPVFVNRLTSLESVIPYDYSQ